VPAESLLELRDATVVLGGTRILDGLTLSIAAGEHTAVLGPNGAGKSTFIKLLTLQQYPVAAANGIPPIRVMGRDRWDVFALRSQFGIVSADLHDRFVQGNSNGTINGLDAVVSGFFASQGVHAHHRVTEEMRRAALDALARVGAEHLGRTMLDTMSTGEARRVLIARALAHQPRALVLDEPTRGLDLVARHHVDEIIPEIGRVILLHRGRVAADGPKAAVLTAAQLGATFDAPLAVEQAGGYYHVRVAE
jgi:iron complex transport system ATP-binding protein